MGRANRSTQSPFVPLILPYSFPGPSALATTPPRFTMFLCPWNCVKSYRALPGACHTLLTADRRPMNGHALLPSRRKVPSIWLEVFSRQWHSSVVAVVNSRLHGFINALHPLLSAGANSKGRFYKYLIARRRRNRQLPVSCYECTGIFCSYRIIIITSFLICDLIVVPQIFSCDLLNNNIAK